MIFAEITKRNYMSESVTLKSYFYEVLIPSSQKNTSSPIEDILHHVSISFMKKLALYKCFNPRTHTGCDYLWLTKIYLCPNVSIHAPTRGATSSPTCRFLWLLVSIHAPTRGATSETEEDYQETLFQSTHPHGVRPHALDSQHLRINLCFNPRTHTGCDLWIRG